MIRKIKNLLHKYIALTANVINGFPARDLYVIGVTGTDGKSTTAYFLYQILARNGKKAAFIGTTGTIINNKQQELGHHVTTPSPFTLQKLIKKVKKTNTQYLILEVTSHSLDQSRVLGIPFQIGILTNVSPEHLDYHKTLENYARTKIKLLKKSSICIVGEDEKGFVKKFLKGKDVTKYGLGQNSDVNKKLFDFPHGLTNFNQKNLLGAIAAARYAGLTDKQINNALSGISLPKARHDTVYNKDFKIVIDFAHTTSSFQNLLPDVKKSTSGRLIHIFGSAGKRDIQKRPQMGEVASKFDDVIILTAEDPRTEKVKDINNDIKKGIKGFSPKEKNVSQVSKNSLFEIDDRKEAIKFAISAAKKGDTVLLSGKGHEKSLNVDGIEHPWDEYKAVEDALI